MKVYHKSVLTEEVIKGLQIYPSGIYVDVTYGGGGHSRAILKKLNNNGKLFGFDQDPDSINNKIDDSRFELILANFSFLTQYLKYYQIDSVDGILADLGVSSHQLDQDSRGFSIRKSSRLDMRMNKTQSLDAHKVINSYDEKALNQIFRRYGELRNSRKITQNILDSRKKNDIHTTFDLIEVLKPLIPIRLKNKFLAQIFQAIRIEVNNELGALKLLLQQAANLLKPGGRLVCISYHSLEDRCVKHFFQNGNFDKQEEKDFFGNPLKVLYQVGKLIIPSYSEIKSNPRSRSAKLRIAQKK